MSRAVQVWLGADTGDHARLQVWSRAYPGGLGVFDRNWLSAEVVVATAARSWRYHAFLRAGDFADFSTALTDLHAGATARARLQPRDPWIAVDVAAVDGGFRCTATARDGGSERGASWSWELDLVGLGRLVAEVRDVAHRFAVGE